MNRLALCDRSEDPGAVDGAWWPRTLELRTELPDLIAVFGRLIGPVRRVVFDPTTWMPAPSRIIRGSTVISVDPYAMVARDTILLVGTHARDAVLYIVPPSTAGSGADGILQAVADASQPMSVSVLRYLVRNSTEAPAQAST
ncbi:DUF5994 family protein [Mycobacterium deserti]|uniref:DUF5994 family protein n=1 Tax=Mycobacterium deserti TaxID=2978347 RepID=A0ABT2M6I3_9MYCO|nr:DUF5994 family protein [Mycobacterium deserti]MCT7657234.1 DUF5994 family protein [Mycobacterium deserti]